MYCINCGKQIGNNDTFCPSCGKNQAEDNQTGINQMGINPNATSIEEDKKRTFALFISLFTVPILYIIRMLEQTTEHVQAGVGGVWASYDRLVVPENIRSVMIIVLLISTCLNVGLRINNKTPGGSKGSVTTAMLFINILFGLVVTFMKVKI